MIKNMRIGFGSIEFGRNKTNVHKKTGQESSPIKNKVDLKLWESLPEFEFLKR